MRVNIYRGTHLVAWTTDNQQSTAEAWRCAVQAVKALAHDEGLEGGSGYTAPKGRVSFERGAYRAVTETMVR